MQNLPSDVASAHEIIRAQADALLSKSEEIEKLRYLVSYFKALKFASSSEKLSGQTERLFDEAEFLRQQAEKQADEFTEVKPYRRKRGGRKPFPKTIPREEIIHDISPADKKCVCCGEEMEKIGEEVTEKLEIVPVKMIVHRHVRPKYSCKPCLNNKKSAEFKIASMPPEILPKSIATAGLFAHVLTNKFCDHIPYYRQERIFQRYGIDISAANLSNWQIQFYERYDRLEEFFWQELLTEKIILADETPLQVMREAERKNTQKSWMFAFATGRIRFFQYRETRSAGFLSERFRDFRGVLASDGYKSYDTLCRRLKIQHAACWAHTRRKFMDVIKNSKSESFADQIVEEIRKLYASEAHSREKEHSPEKILENRREHSQHVVDQIFELLKNKQGTIPRDQPLGKAIRYALGQEIKLRLFLENGNVPIDTNAVENAIRPFVIGRKNWMFSGSPRGANSSALIYSLIETAKANEFEPWAYLRYLFEKLPLCQNDAEMRALLPHRVEPTVLG